MFSRKPKCPECAQKGKHLDKCSFYKPQSPILPESKTPLQELALENTATTIKVFQTTAKSLKAIKKELNLPSTDAAIMALIADYRRNK